jgi:hypothetical protein
MITLKEKFNIYMDTLDNMGDTLDNMGDTLDNMGDTLYNMGDTLYNMRDTLDNMGDTLDNRKKLLYEIRKEVREHINDYSLYLKLKYLSENSSIYQDLINVLNIKYITDFRKLNDNEVYNIIFGVGW